MTTTVAPPESAPAAKNPLRILSIAADLLPAEIVDSRRARKVRRLMLSALAGFAVLLTMWYGVATLQTSAARSTLSGAESDIHRMARQQSAFGELVKVQSESQSISAQLAAVLAGDLRWTTLLSALRQAAPGDVQVTMVSGALSPTSSGVAAESPLSARLPSTTADRLVGTLTISGTASSKAVVAAYVDALAKVQGLADPLLGEVVSENGKLQFTVQLDITSAAPGGRFATKPSTTTGEK
jgi:Tfp pilus assembly protein PilN